MDASDEAINNSTKYVFTFISSEQRKMITFVNYVILCGVISLFGSGANVINMVVFYRQGLDTTINISFFSLAVSDLCSLVFQQLFNIFINPLFVDLDLPIVNTDVQFMTTAIPREMFARITCMITAFITAERCFCIVFPLHVKRMITAKITTTVIIVIFSFTLISPAPFYFTSCLNWKYYPDSNSTLLSIIFTRHHEYTTPMGYLLHSFLTFAGFLSVVTFTLILIYKLGQKSAWRKAANVDLEKAKSMSKRDRATITMVVLIASILVVCYTPAVVLCLIIFILPEINLWGTFSNLYHSCWSVCFLFENLNSSVNIFLYFKMSSKYRQTFRELFRSTKMS